MTSINFTKMHGLGNDFMVIDTINQVIDLSPDQIRFLANRHFGIGFDQLLLVEKSDTDGVDFRYRIFNQDGGEVEQCGNGARCFAQFVREKALSSANPLAVQTKSGIISLDIKTSENGESLVSVNMGSPILELADIPFDESHSSGNLHSEYNLTLADQEVVVTPISMGNPHGVIQVESLKVASLHTLGKAAQTHPAFPEQVNLGIMEVVDRQHIKLRVWERGVGETSACGTGACAAVVAGQINGLLDEEVEVTLPGGKLQICWHSLSEGFESNVIMTGPATTVYEGSIEIP